MSCPGRARVKAHDRTDRLAGKSNRHMWLASRNILSVEELETLPVVTKPGISGRQKLSESARE